MKIKIYNTLDKHGNTLDVHENTLDLPLPGNTRILSVACPDYINLDLPRGPVIVKPV